MVQVSQTYQETQGSSGSHACTHGSWGAGQDVSKATKAWKGGNRLCHLGTCVPGSQAQISMSRKGNLLQRVRLKLTRGTEEEHAPALASTAFHSPRPKHHTEPQQQLPASCFSISHPVPGAQAARHSLLCHHRVILPCGGRVKLPLQSEGRNVVLTWLGGAQSSQDRAESCSLSLKCSNVHFLPCGFALPQKKLNHSPAAGRARGTAPQLSQQPTR